MKNSARTVIHKMFEAFASANVDKILEMVSEDTVWIYHGTQLLPKGEYKGKEGVRKFFNGILNGAEIIRFQPEQFIVEGNMVAVVGNEHQRIKKSGKQLKQKWVQVYTIENNLIKRMEEFASSEAVANQ